MNGVFNSNIERPILLRKANASDALACVTILRGWINEKSWMPMLHSESSMIDFWSSRLINSESWLAENANGVLGFIVRDGDWITALYVASAKRNKGIGSVLLGKAQGLADHLQLWAFQDNTQALAFYARHGFSEIRKTSGDNEENLPDVLLEWKADK